MLACGPRGVFLTTPNRWFPVEVHTALPLLHWLPPRAFRHALARLGLEFFADERNLNLVSKSGLRRMTKRHDDWNVALQSHHVGGWPSNLLLIATRPLGARSFLRRSGRRVEARPMQRDRRGIGDVEARQSALGRDAADEIAMFAREPAQALAFGAEHQRERARQRR